jgi:hypothetical protein
MKSIQIPHIRIDELRKKFNEFVPTFNDFQWQTNKFWFKELFNMNEEKGVQTARRTIVGGEEAELLADTLKQFGFKKLERSFINFSRGFLPIAMHVDVPEGSLEEDGWTIMIPLTFDHRIKTIAFKGKVTEPVFDNWILKQDWTNRKKVNNLREQFDLRSAYYIKPEIIDYMELYGVGDWSKGNAFCFKRSQPHCSTNFKSYGIPYKDYIILQTNYEISGDPSDYIE